MTSATATSAPAPYDVPLDLLVPTAEGLAADPAEARLKALYGTPADRHVRAMMVATVDGGAWGPDHRSGSINDEADWRVFRVLRATADVVLVGAGTARAEGYTALARPRGLAAADAAPLELALVTRSGEVPDALVDQPPLVLTTPAGARTARASVPPERVVVAPDPADEDEVDLPAALDALAARGLARVLCEGGPHLLDAMLRADVVDELCVTTSPRVVGAGPARIVAAGAPGRPGPEAAGLLRAARLGHLLHAPGTGTLLARWELRRS